MHKALIGMGWLAALAMAGTAMAQPGQGQAGPQPDHQKEKQGTGLFPPKQPVPEYSTGRNNVGASLQAHGSAEPNAGATGLKGSGGTTSGWNAPAYSGSERR
jgi:hypothetical protein